MAMTVISVKWYDHYIAVLLCVFVANQTNFRCKYILNNMNWVRPKRHVLTIHAFDHVRAISKASLRQSDTYCIMEAIICGDNAKG